MLRKIWTIAYKDLYITYTDRNLILIMIVTPLALATIIGTAFSGFLGGNAAPIADIPVAVVNLDAGVDAGNGQITNNGAIFVEQLVPEANAASSDPNPESPLLDLTDGVLFEDADAARAAVAAGDYAAAIIIPEHFSRSITITQQNPTIAPVEIEVYASPTSSITAGIIRSITDAIAARIVENNIAIAATLDALIQRAQTNLAFGIQFAASPDALADAINAAFAQAPAQNAPIVVENQTVEGEAQTFNPLVFFGSGIAVFFMLFTANAAATSILEERRDGTLNRLAVSPTPRITILLGKIFGTFLSCIIQVVLLIVALTLVGTLISGQLQIIWGTNIPAIAATIIATAAAASGLGTIIAAFARNAEQANIIGSVVALAMGALGNVFFNASGIPFLRPLSQLTIPYWGSDAFTRLSQGNTDIGLNLVVLLAMGVVTFVIGLAVFNRRIDV